MADVKISGLTAKGAALAMTDTMEINESGTSKSVTGQNIVDMISVALPPKIRGSFLPKAFEPHATNGVDAVTTLEIGSTKPQLVYLPFTNGVDEYADVFFTLPDEYGGEAIKFHVHWTHPTTTVNFTTRWEIAVLALGDDDTMDAVYGNATTVDDIGGTTNDKYETAVISITPTGAAAGDTLLVRLGRLGAHANDNMVVDAYMLSLEYKVDL